MKAIIFAALGIMMALSPAILQESISQELVVLETGIISTASKDYQISNNFVIRVFHDGELIRIKVITALGYPYYAYQKIFDNELELRGKVFIDGKAVPIVKKSTLVKEEETKLEKTSETVADMMILIKQPLSSYYTESYNIIAKVFEASANPLEQFEFNSGLIEGVDIQIILTDPKGNIFRTFEGVTNSMGYVDKRFQWQFADPVGKYDVTVVADDGITKISRQFETDYRGYHPYYSSSDNP